MAKVLDMPKLSPTMTEGQLTVWHKKEGDAVLVDDLLAEVETDKATMEFRSFDKGTLLKQLVAAGALVQLGQPVAILGNPGEDVSTILSGRKEAPGAGQAGAPDRARDQAAGAAVAAATAPAQTPALAVARDGRVRASPYVRKMARERNLDLTRVQGTGPGGRIVARDLAGPVASAGEVPTVAGPAPQTFGSASAPSSTSVAMTPGSLATALATSAESDEIRPLSMMRKAIARRLTESKQTIPHFYLEIDVDAGPLSRLRDQINSDLAARQSAGRDGKAEAAPLKVSFNDLLIKACAIALQRVPDCNSSFTPDALVVHHRIDISVAVAVTEGLVTPVLRSADRKSVIAIATEVRELADRARSKKLRPEEMSGGTFSISNLGMFGIDSFAAVINPPEGAILAVGRVRDEPVLWEGTVVPGKRLAMTLSCDHRVVDGAVGARFLSELRSLVERPTQMLVL